MTDEYLELQVESPLFDFALSYLVEHELGLGTAETLDYKQREAIKFVHAYTRLWDEQCREEVRALTEKRR